MPGEVYYFLLLCVLFSIEKFLDTHWQTKPAASGMDINGKIVMGTVSKG